MYNAINVWLEYLWDMMHGIRVDKSKTWILLNK